MICAPVFFTEFFSTMPPRSPISEWSPRLWSYQKQTQPGVISSVEMLSMSLRAGSWVRRSPPSWARSKPSSSVR